MSEKNVEQKVENKTEKKAEKKVEEKKAMTISGVFKRLGTKAHKDRKALAEAMLAEFKKNNVTENIRGNTLTVNNIGQQIGAMVRDIEAERGKSKNSWWSQFKVVETETEFKIEKKA